MGRGMDGPTRSHARGGTPGAEGSSHGAPAGALSGAVARLQARAPAATPFLAGLLVLAASMALAVSTPAPALAQGGVQTLRGVERPSPLPPPAPASLAEPPRSLQGFASPSPAPGWLGLRLVAELQVSSQGGVGGANPPSVPERGGGRLMPGEGPGAPRIRVEEVVAGGPSQGAGVRAGDHLLRVNGVGAFQALDQGALAALQPGDRVRLTLAREGRLLEIQVQARLRPDYEASLRAREVASVRADSVQRVVALQMERVRHELASGRAGSLPVREETPAERRGSVIQLRRVPEGEAGAEGRVVATFQRPSFQLDSLARLRGEASVSTPASVPPSGVTLLRFRGGPGPAGAESPAVTLRFFGDRTLLGAQVTPVNAGLATYFGVRQGVLVTEVVEGAPAALGGVRSGDVIVGVRWRTGRAEPVTEVAALRAAVEAAWEAPPLTLRLVREGRSVEVEIPTRR